MRRHKYRPGPPIRDPLHAIALLMAGQWLYWNDKPQSPAWLLNMQIRTLVHSARSGTLRIAIPNEEAVKP